MGANRTRSRRRRGGGRRVSKARNKLGFKIMAMVEWAQHWKTLACERQSVLGRGKGSFTGGYGVGWTGDLGCGRLKKDRSFRGRPRIELGQNVSIPTTDSGAAGRNGRKYQHRARSLHQSTRDTRRSRHVCNVPWQIPITRNRWQEGRWKTSVPPLRPLQSHVPLRNIEFYLR